MSRMRIVLVAIAALALCSALAVAGSRNSSPAKNAATAKAKFAPGEEELGASDAFWNQRLTYPTGRYNPAWLRAAAQQAARLPSRRPAGGSSWVPLGPQPERMDGCGGCFNYHKTEGRVNAIVVDPTTTSNGSIVAYAGTVGGGVWKTTNCCSTSTTWTVTTDGTPMIGSIAIDALALDPNDHNTIYAGR